MGNHVDNGARMASRSLRASGVEEITYPIRHMLACQGFFFFSKRTKTVILIVAFNDPWNNIQPYRPGQITVVFFFFWI
jgi:hypothetical protein